MKSRGGLGQWREKEFLTEIQKRGEERLSENLREIQLPLVASPVVSCERSSSNGNGTNLETVSGG